MEVCIHMKVHKKNLLAGEQFQPKHEIEYAFTFLSVPGAVKSTLEGYFN